MANVLKPKRSSTASLVPTTSNLVSGEIGVNMADKKIYINNGTAVVQIGAGTLSGHSDVTLTSLTSGQALQWNGTAWVNSSAGTGTVTSVAMTVPTGLTVSGSPITSSGTLAVTLTAGYSIPTTASQTNWDSAYTQRLQWDGGSTNLVAATGRTSLGGSTVGQNFFTLTNPSAITFPRINADNSVSTLSAADFRTAIGAGTGSGTVTSVTGTSPVTSSGGATPAIGLASGYGDTQNPYASKTANFVLASPNGTAGAPTFRAIVAADIPTLNQNTTGSSGSCTGNAATATTATTATNQSGGTVAATTGSFSGQVTSTVATGTSPFSITSTTLNSNLNADLLDGNHASAFYLATNPSGYTANTGTVTSVGGTGTVSGLTLTGTVTTTGNLTLGGTLAVTPSNFASQTAYTALAAPEGSNGTPTFRNLTLMDLPNAWVKKAVDCATTAALTINTAQTTIDGVTLTATSRVLVKDQATASQNGIYTGLTTTTWVRAVDADTTAEIAGAMVNVDAGTTNGGLTFDTDFKVTDTLGTTAMSWNRVLDRGYLTTVGNSFSTLTNPSAITFPRINADNTVSTLDAATFRTAIGAGTGSGTVTSVTGTAPVASSGGATPAISLASGYGDTQNPFASKTANYFLAAPNGVAGAPTFRAIVAADIPTLNQNTTGSSGSCTGNAATATTATNQSGGTVAATTGSFSGQVTSTLATGTAPFSITSTTVVPNLNVDMLDGNHASAFALVGQTTYVGTTAIALNRASAAQSLTGITSIDGSAATLTTGRTIAITGDIAYTSPSFNGSANVTAAATLATVNANVGTFGSAAAIPVVTVNAKGLVTGVSTVSVAGGQYFGSAATKAIAYNSNTISENITITAGNNGLSAGPITVSTGFTVTVATGANWVIV